MSTSTIPAPDLAVAHVMAAYLTRFHECRERWKQETTFTSSMTKIEGHPAYREIVAMGWPVVPLLLRELRERPAWWFGALSEITGEQPTKAEHAGDLAALAEDWLRWGEQRGLV